MSLTDFARKEWRIAREHGVRSALKQSISETTMKAARPYADYKATPIWESDFDVCLVLDSCRYDLFAEVVNELPWDAFTKSVVENQGCAWSVGSASPEWISNTFADEYSDEWRNTGYVTANPFSGKQGDEMRALDSNVVPLAARGFAYLDEVWVDEWPMADNLPTVAPSTVTNRALWAWNRRERHSMETMVVHYMQPHIPFKKQPDWTAGWDVERFGTAGEGKDDWHKVRDGDIPEDEFWNAYAANLEWVLKEVARWHNAIDGTILITSDHGNAMGECGQWGHPPGSANPAIRKVPWCVVDGIGDNEITVEPSGNPPVVGGENRDVDAQLSALGYT